MTDTQVVLVIATTALTVAWLLAVGAVRVYRQPREPQHLEPTLELGPEPPALAAFLADNFRVPHDAVPATLLDLSVRGIAEIERIDVDTYQCRLQSASFEGLAAYEQRVLEHLRQRARDGIVPTQALTTGPGGESSRWWRAFANEVVDAAQEQGLSRNLWSRRLAALFAVAAAVPTILMGIAYGEEGFFLYAVLPVAVIGKIRYGRRQRDTPTGLEAAARWRAVQAKLAQDPVFAEQPPTAVALWKRQLAYGAALGVAPGAIRPVPMGAEPDTRAWSTYGGRWHEVHVRYRHWPQWGVHPAWAVLHGLLLVCFGVLFLWFAGPILFDALDEAGGVFQLVLLAVLAIAGLLAAAGCVLVVRAALDLSSVREITGEIVRLRIREGRSDSATYYVAVDDGTTRTVHAWSVRPEVYSGLTQGQVVVAQVTPRLRYVRSIEPTANHVSEGLAASTARPG
jgi:hypothetical protein